VGLKDCVLGDAIDICRRHRSRSLYSALDLLVDLVFDVVQKSVDGAEGVARLRLRREEPCPL
jgi:hypothetical protein